MSSQKSFNLCQTMQIESTFFKIRQKIINKKPFKNTAKSCMNYVEQKEKKTYFQQDYNK